MFVKNPNLGADPNLGDFTVYHSLWFITFFSDYGNNHFYFY